MLRFFKKSLKIEDTSDGLIITIPSEKTWIELLFSGAWYGIWYVFFGVTCIFWFSMFPGFSLSKILLPIIFIFWTISGLKKIINYQQELPANEIIEFKSQRLIIKKKNLFYTLGKSYDLKLVRFFATSNHENGALEFNYKNQTVVFGHDLDKSEGYDLINLLKAKKLID